ncbi:hypothetical protein COLO4_04235 [Corchorus olitorius]|uniref:Uncharacterized protein n=1 Tax=Corchorus olitorius TaxID=93759 RepID=A0A1R3KUQ9_9ROSI|nr:hypothetical protein COLO4_04235 [Corchorus olitorius]
MSLHRKSGIFKVCWCVSLRERLEFEFGVSEWGELESAVCMGEERWETVENFCIFSDVVGFKESIKFSPFVSFCILLKMGIMSWPRSSPLLHRPALHHRN